MKTLLSIALLFLLFSSPLVFAQNTYTVDGKEPLTIPAGTQPNTILVLDNKGVPKLGNPVSRGNHLITVKIHIPNKISSEEREILEKLAAIRGEATGKGSKEGFLGGLFQK